MRMNRVVGSLAMSLALGATTAWAQFAPYGSPEPIQLPQYAGYGASAISPAPMVAAQPVYSGAVVPVSVRQPIDQLPPPPMPQGSMPATAPLAAPAPSVVQQMVQPAPVGHMPSGDCYGGNLYGEACGSGGGAVYSEPAYGSYDSCGPVMADACGVNCCNPWFASVYGLYLGRDQANNVWLSYDMNDLGNQTMRTNDADVSWEPGFEVTFGRHFCECGTGFEVTYWTLFDNFRGSASVGGIDDNGFGTVGTPLRVDGIEFVDVGFDGPQNGVDFFDGAQEHCISRINEIHNLEANFFRVSMVDPCCSPFTFDWLAGIRWFSFREELSWSTLAGPQWSADPVDWHTDGGRYSAVIQDEVRNDLLGFQIGFNAAYNFHPCWKVFAAPKIGIYNNHIQHDFYAMRGDGLVATDLTGLGSYPVCSEDDALAFLTEIDLGLDWQITCRWSATIGYRVLVASGVALADEQIPFYINDIPEIADIDDNSELILHGAFVGTTFRF